MGGGGSGLGWRVADARRRRKIFISKTYCSPFVRGEGSRKVADARLTEGGGGVWDRQILNDVICESSLTQVNF